jgi:hypothetical protein
LNHPAVKKDSTKSPDFCIRSIDSGNYLLETGIANLVYGKTIMVYDLLTCGGILSQRRMPPVI